ncbi:IclR family transcriptional regulator [Polymorphobacter fuscus]|uniref:Helix-turn-helix domain-containing protein n=1 Tax=Sandarakinorhabdus fusca TaxID=1439888 RepID=A0A7C9GQM9_9SPHN|nr:IclR family transcriptional regulator [Polymorphobacter fuscus]KAB7644093.1 IclR family transcriptional regulator [Polymorphobacter fuscus]MQT18475.1 helix-turn-helix domain-containing protein [Polymorphobacter fuscus]NJC08404.1 DNA-binding IclR family transcriptional regulator [Polymorphobacter fuscus]
MGKASLDKDADGGADGKPKAVSQTLLRGLDVIDAVVDGPLTLAALAAKLQLTRSTTHRLAAALIDRRYLVFTPRTGYQFGPKLLELGFAAQRQTDIIQVARPHLEALAADTEDTVHFGISDGDRALYLDKIPGRRRVEISSRVGDRQPLTATGLGKALLLDDVPARWRTLFDADRANGAPAADYDIWLQRMEAYVAAGRAYDLEENEDQIRCVAAPVRDVKGRIVAAISVSSAAQYMADGRMAALSDDVRGVAAAISADLGWTGRKR